MIYKIHRKLQSPRDESYYGFYRAGTKEALSMKKLSKSEDIVG